MERKTALATAAAITMSVVSGFFALGAASGTSSLGTSTTPAPAVQGVATTASPRSHETEKQDSASAATRAQGEIDD